MCECCYQKLGTTIVSFAHLLPSVNIFHLLNGFHVELLLHIFIQVNHLFILFHLSCVFPSCSSFLPVGVLFMTASYVVEVGDDWETVFKLGKFAAVVVSGYVLLCSL